MWAMKHSACAAKLALVFSKADSVYGDQVIEQKILGSWFWNYLCNGHFVVKNM